MKGYGEEEEEDEERGVLKDEERESRNVSLRKRRERIKTLSMNMSYEQRIHTYPLTE